MASAGLLAGRVFEFRKIRLETAAAVLYFSGQCAR